MNLILKIMLFESDDLYSNVIEVNKRREKNQNLEIWNTQNSIIHFCSLFPTFLK